MEASCCSVLGLKMAALLAGSTALVASIALPRRPPAIGAARSVFVWVGGWSARYLSIVAVSAVTSSCLCITRSQWETMPVSSRRVAVWVFHLANVCARLRA